MTGAFVYPAQRILEVGAAFRHDSKRENVCPEQSGAGTASAMGKGPTTMLPPDEAEKRKRTGRVPFQRRKEPEIVFYEFGMFFA